MSHYAGWSEDRINAAKKLFLEGKSASEIAAALGGGLTRCAVIGKPHRMGWTSTHRQAPTSTGKVRAPNLKGHRPAPPKPGPQNRPGAVFGAVTVENAAETERKRALHRAEGEALVAAMSGPANDDAILLIDRRTFQCSFPVGTPDRPANQMCCGQPVPTDAGRAVPTYCTAHARVCLSKSQPVRKVPSEPSQRRAA